jgi:hypothetical protein
MRTVGVGFLPVSPNSALLTDAFSSLRCACSTAKGGHEMSCLQR